MSRTMCLAFSGTDIGGHKIGDHITAAHVMRLMIQNDPHDKYIISLNPQDPLNFVFDQICLEFNIEIVWDRWTPGDLFHVYKEFDERRRTRMVHGLLFDTYKEIYLRTSGGDRQGILCGREKGLGRRNIFEYLYYGQETSPKHCFGGASFDCSSLGYKWEPTAPQRSVFVAPIAFSQSNDVFTMEFWKRVIDGLLAQKVKVTVNTPNDGQFGQHDLLSYSFKKGDYRGLFEQVRHERLTLHGNTGIGWIAGASGVPLIAGEPRFFWFQDYRYREAGVQTVVDIFGKQSGREHMNDTGPGIPADSEEPIRMVLDYLDSK